MTYETERADAATSTSRRIAGAAVAVVLLATGACGNAPVVASAATKGPSGASTSATATESPYREPEGQDVILPAANAGGSAAQLEFPCDSGTATVDVHPDGAGVSMSETLRGVADQKWFSNGPTVTPFLGPDGDPVPTPLVAHSGDLTVTATNLVPTGSHKIDNSTHAWPQQAQTDLFTRQGLDCGATLYMTDEKVNAFVANFVAFVRRDTGTISVGAGTLPTGGRWKVTVVAESPSGLTTRSRTVKTAKHYRWDTRPSLSSGFAGFPHLDDFTKLTITVANSNGSSAGRRIMIITRTP